MQDFLRGTDYGEREHTRLVSAALIHGSVLQWEGGRQILSFPDPPVAVSGHDGSHHNHRPFLFFKFRSLTAGRPYIW